MSYFRFLVINAVIQFTHMHVSFGAIVRATCPSRISTKLLFNDLHKGQEMALLVADPT